jgi:hypothetical protein
MPEHKVCPVCQHQDAPVVTWVTLTVEIGPMCMDCHREAMGMPRDGMVPHEKEAHEAEERQIQTRWD